MLRIDLEAAGVSYVVQGPDGPLYADFHSLRHSYVALLDRAGLTLKEMMQLARHSDPKLTAARYGRVGLHDLSDAVGRMPCLLPRGTAGGERLQSTETADTSAAAAGTKVGTNLAQTGDSGRSRVMTGDDGTPDGAVAVNHCPLRGLRTSEDDKRVVRTVPPAGIRTCDPRFRKPMLYPLSYGGKSFKNIDL